MYPRNVNPVVYILVILFGIASWVDINGLWVELPILVQELPEGWTLPSYMVIIIQLANIGPFLYTLTSIHCPKRLPEKPVIYGIIGVGVSACILLIFFWDWTSLVGGHRHSTALLILNFFLALVDTTSSVAFLPFMAIFKPSYMTAYFIGEGLSGLLPGIMGLAQGAGRIACVNVSESVNVTINETTDVIVRHSLVKRYIDTNFSIEVFLMFIGAMIVVSGISFTLLCYHPLCKKEYAEHHNLTLSLTELKISESKAENVKFIKETPLTSHEDIDSSFSIKPHQGTEKDKAKDVSQKDYVIALLITAYACAMTNAVLISVQTYSCLPYGTSPYHLTVTLSNVANPLACFVAFMVTITSGVVLCILCAVASAMAVYILIAAAMSPEPFLVGTEAGSAFIVMAWVLCMFLFTYVKVGFASMLRGRGKRGLLYCGAATQVGSLVGGIIMFVLVNVQHLFVMARPCAS